MEATPPQPSPIATRASFSPRPNSHNPHSYLRSDNWSERGESRPHSPASLSKRFQSGEGKGEGAGDHSRTEKSRQGNLGSHPASAGSVPILPQPDRTDILLSVTPLTRWPLARLGSVASCPLAVTAIPLATFAVAGHGTGLLLSRCAAVPWERPFPYDPLLFPYADACTHRQQGGPHDRLRSREPPWIPRGRGNPPPYPADPSRSRERPAIPRGSLAVAGTPRHTPRIPRGRGTRFVDRPGVPTATTNPGRCMSVRTPHTPVPGAPPPRGTSQPSPSRGSTGGHIIGTIRGQPCTAVAPGPSL